MPSGALPKMYPTELVNAVRERYESGLTQAETALAVGITQKVVWNLMRRHGKSSDGSSENSRGST